jgi:hypothetical protein
VTVGLDADGWSSHSERQRPKKGLCLGDCFLRYWGRTVAVPVGGATVGCDLLQLVKRLLLSKCLAFREPIEYCGSALIHRSRRVTRRIRGRGGVK